MKKEKKLFKNCKGFTLLEMLVVVLIIGILAGIALPQYQMAVTKAKVATILPLMRRWYDAMAEYKLQHGSYLGWDCDTLGVSWPGCEDSNHCTNVNNFWNECMANEEPSGYVWCSHDIDSNNSFTILMYQPDDHIMTCEAYGAKAEKVCKALGGKLLEDVNAYCGSCSVYKLN